MYESTLNFLPGDFDDITFRFKTHILDPYKRLNLTYPYPCLNIETYDNYINIFDYTEFKDIEDNYLSFRILYNV